jgi:hypothetical protein
MLQANGAMAEYTKVRSKLTPDRRSEVGVERTLLIVLIMMTFAISLQVLVRCTSPQKAAFSTVAHRLLDEDRQRRDTAR